MLSRKCKGAVEATQSITAAVKEGDGRGIAAEVSGAFLDAATDKFLGKKGRDSPTNTKKSQHDDESEPQRLPPARNRSGETKDSNEVRVDVQDYPKVVAGSLQRQKSASTYSED